MKNSFLRQTLLPTVKVGDVFFLSYFGLWPVKVEGCMDPSQYQLIRTNNVYQSVTKVKLHRGWLFLQGNDPKHSSTSTKAHMQRNRYNVLESPSESTDMNNIEICGVL